MFFSPLVSCKIKIPKTHGQMLSFPLTIFFANIVTVTQLTLQINLLVIPHQILLILLILSNRNRCSLIISN